MSPGTAKYPALLLPWWASIEDMVVTLGKSARTAVSGEF